MARTCYVAARGRNLLGADISFEALALSRTHGVATRVAFAGLEYQGQPALIGYRGLRGVEEQLPECVVMPGSSTWREWVRRALRLS